MKPILYKWEKCCYHLGTSNNCHSIVWGRFSSSSISDKLAGKVFFFFAPAIPDCELEHRKAAWSSVAMCSSVGAVSTQHQTRAKHKVRVRDEDCAKSKSSRHNACGVDDRWENMATILTGNKSRIRSKMRLTRAKCCFWTAESVLRGEILGVRSQKNWGRDCVLWRKKKFNMGCLAWSVPSVSPVVCTGAFERGDWLKWNQERHEVGFVIFSDFEFRRRKHTGDLEYWRQWSSFGQVNGSTFSDGFEEPHSCRWGRRFERWHWLQSRSVGLKWRWRDSWWQWWCSFSSGVCCLHVIHFSQLENKQRGRSGGKLIVLSLHGSNETNDESGGRSKSRSELTTKIPRNLGRISDTRDGWVWEDKGGECWREKIVIQAKYWLHVVLFCRWGAKMMWARWRRRGRNCE